MRYGNVGSTCEVGKVVGMYVHPKRRFFAFLLVQTPKGDKKSSHNEENTYSVYCGPTDTNCFPTLARFIPESVMKQMSFDIENGEIGNSFVREVPVYSKEEKKEIKVSAARRMSFERAIMNWVKLS